MPTSTRTPSCTTSLLSVSHELEEAEMLRHHFSYFVMHAQAILPHDVQPPPLQGSPCKGEEGAGKIVRGGIVSVRIIITNRKSVDWMVPDVPAFA